MGASTPPAYDDATIKKIFSLFDFYIPRGSRGYVREATKEMKALGLYDHPRFQHELALRKILNSRNCKEDQKKFLGSVPVFKKRSQSLLDLIAV